MPRAVFKLMWDTISSGREIFAYVLNLAADGAHYWVLAHVTPSFGSHGKIVGYHSSRRLPDREAVETARAIYARLLNEERRHDSRQAGLDASTRLLTSMLAEAGASYEELLWSIVPAGMAR
jgi:hypothetical protein